MIGGISGCRGILLYDTKKTEYSAVYGYYDENEQIILTRGTYDEMKKVKDETEAPFLKEDRPTVKIVIGLFLAMLVTVIACFIFAPFVIAFGVLVFCAIAYFPSMIIIVANTKMYDDDRYQQSFRRFHGCEHAIVRLQGKEKELTVEKLKKTSIYHRECGTAYSGYAVFLAIVIALLIFNIHYLGILKVFLFLLLTVVLLILNIFNPLNPFVLLQRPAIAKPTDREYALGIAVANALWSTNEES
jgi:uncharacterized protein YqhQ